VDIDQLRTDLLAAGQGGTVRIKIEQLAHHEADVTSGSLVVHRAFTYLAQKLTIFLTFVNVWINAPLPTIWCVQVVARTRSG
jgi:hypothetical protein